MINQTFFVYLNDWSDVNSWIASQDPYFKHTIATRGQGFEKGVVD